MPKDLKEKAAGEGFKSAGNMQFENHSFFLLKLIFLAI
jgi:hypothetical protein